MYGGRPSLLLKMLYFTDLFLSLSFKFIELIRRQGLKLKLLMIGFRFNVLEFLLGIFEQLFVGGGVGKVVVPLCLNEGGKPDENEVLSFDDQIF